MHESIESHRNKSIVEAILKDYQSKYNIVKSEVEKYRKEQKNSKIPCYSNFACYLECINESDSMKHNIFSIALLEKAEVLLRSFSWHVDNSFRRKSSLKWSKKPLKRKWERIWLWNILLFNVSLSKALPTLKMLSSIW